MKLSNRTQALIKRIIKFSTKHYARLVGIVANVGDGVWFWDSEGRKYLDFVAGYGASNQGHSHSGIKNAVRSLLTKGWFMGPGSLMTVDEAGLKESICNVSGMAVAALLNTGAEPFELAVKISRKYGYTEKGIRKDTAEIIVAIGNFHGRTYAPLSASSNEAIRKNFGPFLPGFVKVPYGDAKEIRGAINKKTAAVIIEPIQGEGGVIVPPVGYLAEVKKICKAAGILFILDEVQTGFGRTGKMFAYMHENAKPDALLVGKSFGGGLVPISALLFSEEFKDLLQPGDHGSTWAGGPMARAVGSAAIRIIQEEGLVENSATLGTYLMEQLEDRIGHLPMVAEIRGKGLFVAVEFEKGSISVKELCTNLLKPPSSDKAGLFCMGTGQEDRTLRLSTPLCITKDEIDYAIDRIEASLI